MSSDMSVLLGACGAVFGSLGAIRYLRALVKDRIKPRLSSWLAWTVSWLSMLVIGIATKNIVATVFAAAGFIRSGLVITITSFKQASTWNMLTRRQDLMCLATSFSCIMVLFVDPVSACNTTLAAVANLIATWPTARQVWSAPHDESWHLYAANSVSCVLACLGVTLSCTPTIYAFSGPMISLFGNLCVLTLILSRRIVLVQTSS